LPVRHAILGLLAQRPRYGYELRAALVAVVGGEQNWDVKPAQIYTTFARLEQANLIVEERVEQDAGPEKRIYDITPAGRGELDKWFASGVQREHQRDEVYIKLMIAMASGVAEPYALLRTQRRHLYQELHDITLQRGQIDPKSELSKILLLEQAAMHLEADLRWLDMFESRLDEIRRQPLPEPEVKVRGRPRKNPQ
jgi:DNA-binding PadR family transcriptional regulator